jgi:cell cycle arrest protein BUB3
VSTSSDTADPRWNTADGQCKVLGKHEDAVSAMVWVEEFSEQQHTAELTLDILITVSWDSTLRVWDP